jgi:hypothetical protein
MLPNEIYAPQPDNQSPYGGAVSSPDLSDSTLKPKNRAIRDAKQAQNIITSLEVANKERNLKNARIMAKYNSERPYTQQQLESEGLGWKSNFTSKPLPMLIDKVAPRFTQAIDGVKYITNSALPDDVEGASEKTDAFRREITSVARARPGWREFMSEIGQENALFGYTAAAWLDEFSWFPKFFRQDQFFIPTGTKQSPSGAQIVALRETFLLHELFSLISDKEAAIARGWNIQETVTAINEAMPEDRRSRQTDYWRVYEDMIRESVVGTSYENGARVVTVWHLLATEIDGKISHYIFNNTSFKELFSAEDQFDSMMDAVAFFSFQQGNGTMHGSKGIGREIYAMAGILDRSRNEVVDRLNLAGKLIIQGDEKQLRRFKMSIVGNTILIGEAFTVVEHKIDAAVEPFLTLDNFLTGLLDQMAGSTTPKVFEGERVTKAQVDLFASREEETRDSIIGRFLSQFATMVTTMQRRMCDPHTSDKDAKDMQERLLKIMTREELTQLSKQVVAETVKDYTDVERQQVVLVAQEARGNPLYNAKELERRKVTALINEEFADAVLLPDNDPTVEAEQTRLQQMELLLIVGQATAVPVSPRDNHLIHLGILMPVMEQTAQQAVQNPKALDVLSAVLAHAEAHFQAAEAQGTPKDQLADIGSKLTQLRSVIDRLHQNAAQAQQVDQATQARQGQIDQAAAAIPAPPAQIPTQ